MKVIRLLLSEKCCYQPICNLYRPGSETCNVNPGPYCGRYRLFHRKGVPPLASTGDAKQAHDTTMHYTTENIPKAKM